MKFLLIILISSIAFGAGIKEQKNTDIFQMGVGDSTDNKEIIFNTGDGVNNPSLYVDPALEDFNLNKSLNVKGNYLTLGDGTNTDIFFNFDIGAGSSNPYFRYNTVTSSLAFNNGSVEKKIGSGSGSSGGGVTFIENGGFEDGVGFNWSATPLTLTQLDSGSQFIGENSALFNPTNINEFLESSLYTIPLGLRGQSCQFEFYYKGGDENLTVELLFADNTVFKTMQLKTNNLFSVENIFFLCPNEQEILNNFNKSQLKIRFYQNSAVDAEPITIDSFYLGSLKGLVETTLPDILTGKIETAGNNIVTDGGFINSFTRSGGTYTLNYRPGLFSEAPDVISIFLTDTDNNGAINVREILASTKDTMTFVTTDNNALTTAEFATITVRKKGADAKQTVQVYKSIPKVSENVNIFTARVSATGEVSEENADFINGDCTFGLGYVCNLNQAYSLSCNYEPDSLGLISYDNTGSTSDNNFLNPRFISRGDSSSTNLQVSFSITCVKRGDDFKLPTVQPIVVGQVTNSQADQATKNLSFEGCKVLSTNTATTEGCDSFVSLAENYGNNHVRLTFVPGVFEDSTSVVCTGNRYLGIENFASTSGGILDISFISKDKVEFHVNQLNTGATINCKGIR